MAEVRARLTQLTMHKARAFALGERIRITCAIFQLEQLEPVPGSYVVELAALDASIRL